MTRQRRTILSVVETASSISMPANFFAGRARSILELIE